MCTVRSISSCRVPVEQDVAWSPLEQRTPKQRAQLNGFRYAEIGC